MALSIPGGHSEEREVKETFTFAGQREKIQ